MRLLIAGWQGQLARALVEQAPGAADIDALAVGRPGLDLCVAATITRAMTDFRPDVIINTAAYTGVDRAEGDAAAAFALNRDGAGQLAAAAAKRNAAIIHVSTDYVFDGAKGRPYVEDDPTGPLNVFGRSKLAGEAAVRAANPRHVIVRTAWVHSATGRNFVRTILGRAATEAELRVVDDQLGSPTYAPHLAQVVLAIARRVTAGGDPSLWGTYHAAGLGHTSWHGLASEVFAVSARLGGPAPRLAAIPATDYPVVAKRPVHAGLDCGKLQAAFGIALPDWRDGVAAGVARILGANVATP